MPATFMSARTPHTANNPVAMNPVPTTPSFKDCLGDRKIDVQERERKDTSDV